MKDCRFFSLWPCNQKTVSHRFHQLLLFSASIVLFLSTTITQSIPPSISPHSTTMNALEITVDCNQTSGTITSFAEINCGPLPVYYIKDGVDITDQYQEIGITFIRTHDFNGPTDISTIFPNWEADPSDKNSYNFTSSDEVITSIIKAGCTVLYRLGESASDNKSLRIPPENFSKWAEICKHIIMHYNDGWNNGFHYNISYWEIWNEPDLKGFWNGTAEEYYHLYHTTVQTLKSYNSSLKIGGPCTSSVFNTNYTTGFLTYLLEHDLPLDFYSWHCYANTPYELYTQSRIIRNLLDSFGFTDCENINTEWNINILAPQRDKDNAKNAAFTACTLTAFQDACIDHAFRYRGTQDNNWLMRFIGFDLSLFTYDGRYKTPALSYLAMQYLSRDTPIRLSTPEMNASSGITYLLGISKDRSNISILISNYNALDATYSLNITNLPWHNTSYTIAHYLIDNTHHLEIIKQDSASSANYCTTQTIKQATVHFIRLTNSTILPEEGPSVAPIPLILRIPFLDPIARSLGVLLLFLLFT